MEKLLSEEYQPTINRRLFFKKAVAKTAAIALSSPVIASILVACDIDIDKWHFIPTPDNLKGEVGKTVEVDLHNLRLVNPDKAVRIALYYPVNSRQVMRDERDLITNVFSLNGDPLALIYDVQKEVLLPGQETLSNKGWWEINVVGDLINQDPSLTSPSGNTQPITARVYSTFAQGENANTRELTGPIVLLPLAKRTQ